VPWVLSVAWGAGQAMIGSRQQAPTHSVGPDSAAEPLIAAGDNPERLTCEASFAALCGAARRRCECSARWVCWRR